MNHDYTPYYCEENIWRLLQHDDLAGRERYAVFVSNLQRGCALWFQRAAASPSDAVFWDYHVIALARREDGALDVYDLDTTLPSPCPLAFYLDHTFWGTEQLPSTFAPLFRVIDGARFIEDFSSDRAHMLDDEGNYRQPPPSWPAIGQQTKSNLMNLVDMSAPSPGTIVTIDGLRALETTLQ